MKYLFILLFLFQIQYCSKVNNTDGLNNEKEVLKSTKIVVIDNITKTCYKNLTKNIYDYILCLNWSLNKNDIQEIVSLGKKNNKSEILNVLNPAIPSWISADITIDGNSYKIEINAMSYYFLTDNKGHRDLYTFDLESQEKVEKYFIRKLTEDDDSNYENKKVGIKKYLETNAIDISKWNGIFKFDNNNYEQLYKIYTINIYDKNIFFYEGELPGCKIQCTSYKVDDTIYFYYDSTKTNCINFDTSLIENMQDGDFLFKLYSKKEKKYLESPVIKYWDDKSSNFRIYTPIEINYSN
ncbi:hypothetical protein ACFQH0_07240 [Frigoriflavimonas asaccharolytica]